MSYFQEGVNLISLFVAMLRVTPREFPFDLLVHQAKMLLQLQNMPVPLTAEMVDEYMGPVLEAARDGDLTLIRNV